MPEQRESDREHSQQRADGRKHDAELRDLVPGDQVGRELPEHIVQLASALGRVIGSTGYIRHLLQRVLIDAPAKPAEPAAAEPTAKLAAVERAAAPELRATKGICRP